MTCKECPPISQDLAVCAGQHHPCPHVWAPSYEPLLRELFYCRVVQDKAYETGIPQKLGEHANTARDAAAQKYSDLTTEVTD